MRANYPQKTANPTDTAVDLDLDTPVAPQPGVSSSVLKWVIPVLLLAVIGWVAFAPLEEGVPAAGNVTVDTKRKAVQHLSGGVVRQLLVAEGQIVKAGEVLALIEDSSARAQFESASERYITLRAQEARLVAERDGTASMQGPVEFQAAPDQHLIRQKWRAQEDLLASRRAEVSAAVAALAESINGQRTAQATANAMLVSRREQLVLLQRQIGDVRSLVAQEFEPRNRLLELERQAAELSAVIQGLEGNAASAARSISELTERIALRRSEYRRDVADQIAVVYRDIEATHELRQASGNELARTEIKAPAGGQIVGLTVPGPGTVLQPGQKMADVVPLEERRVIEVRVLPNLVNRVHGGQNVDIRFSSFAEAPHLVVRGQVTTVSADALLDPATQRPYHLARVMITPQGFASLGARELTAGMPADVVFLTGKRSLLVYWMQPLLRRVAASLTEA